MRAEISVMDKFEAYELVDRPPSSVNVVGSRWVYARKTDSAGLLSRLKARLVAKGFSQQEGVDFSETFAPTGRLRVFRAMMADPRGLCWS